MKKPARVLPLLALFVAFGCSSDNAGPESTTGVSGGTTTATTQSTPFKVALLTPGPVTDGGWSALAYDGLQTIKTDLGAEVNNQQATDSGIKDAMRTYAQDGYSLIIGHGYEYNQVESEVAKDFPKTVFVSSSGGLSGTNFGAFRFYLEQSFYLAGMMAASMSKTGVVGTVGLDVPSIVSTFKAFEAGAKAVNPNIKFVRKMVPLPGNDPAAYKQATFAAIAEKADFIIHQANEGKDSVFGAAKEKGVYVFGSNSNQNDNPSGVVIASAVIVAKPAFLDLAKQVKDGTYKGGVTLMGMDKGAIDFVINPKFADKVPAELKAKIDQAKADITSGKLIVPKDEF
jgi:basic membrane protein A and related proteins